MNLTIISLDGRCAEGDRRETSQLKPHSSQVTLLGVAIIFGLVALLVSGAAQAASTRCSGVQLYPGDDLSLVAAAHAPGTTYCINDGNYSVASNIVVQDGDTFSGVVAAVSPGARGNFSPPTTPADWKSCLYPTRTSPTVVPTNRKASRC